MVAAALARLAADRTGPHSRTLIAVDPLEVVRLVLRLVPAATALVGMPARMATATEALDASTTTTELLVIARRRVVPRTTIHRPEGATKTRIVATIRLPRLTPTPTAAADRTTGPPGTFLHESPRTHQEMGMPASTTEAGVTGKYSLRPISSLGFWQKPVLDQW